MIKPKRGGIKFTHCMSSKHNQRLWKSVENRAIISSTAESCGARLQEQHLSDVQQSERLAYLGIMEVQLRALLKLPIHHSTIVFRDLREILNCVPIMPRDANLSDRYTSDRCCLSSLVVGITENLSNNRNLLTPKSLKLAQIYIYIYTEDGLLITFYKLS